MDIPKMNIHIRIFIPEMNTTRFKNVFLKYLFAVIILLSFFTFSGFVAQSKTTLNKPQITLVVNSSLRPFKSINYKRAIVSLSSKDPVIPILIDISRLYSQQVKIQITELTQSYIPTPIMLLYKPNTASQNADDDFVLILV
jgi:hypothetical protein